MNDEDLRGAEGIAKGCAIGAALWLVIITIGVLAFIHGIVFG